MHTIDITRPLVRMTPVTLHVLTIALAARYKVVKEAPEDVFVCGDTTPIKLINTVKTDAVSMLTSLVGDFHNLLEQMRQHRVQAYELPMPIKDVYICLHILKNEYDSEGDTLKCLAQYEAMQNLEAALEGREEDVRCLETALAIETDGKAGNNTITALRFIVRPNSAEWQQDNE